MEVVIKHLGFMRKLESTDASLDVRIIDALEEYHPYLPTAHELRLTVCANTSIEKLRTRLDWLQEQGILELLPERIARSIRVRLTVSGREWAREFSCQRQNERAERTPHDCMVEREAKSRV
jgi:hypothetical protein